MVKEVDNIRDGNFDQVNQYDFAGRLKTNKVGPSGGTFKQTMGYDAFSNLTSRSSKTYSLDEISFESTYTNNRRSGDWYDAAGNLIRSVSNGQNLQGGSSWFYSDKYWLYNAAGKMSRWEEEGPWGEETRRGGESTFDGDGRPVKHAELKSTRTNDDWGAWESTMEWYYLYSSVTGQKVNDIYDGLYAGSVVHLGDSVIHDDTYKGPYWGSTNPPQEHSWGFATTDPITGSTQEMIPDGTVAARNELAGLGTSVPSQAPENPYAPNPHIGGYAGNAECIIQWDGFEIGGAHCGPLELAGAHGYTDFAYKYNFDFYPAWPLPSLFRSYGGGDQGLWSVADLTSAGRKVIEDALKNNPKGDCARLFNKDALEEFDRIAKDIEYDPSVVVGRREDSAREQTLGERPEISAVTFDKEIRLNPRGYAFADFSVPRTPKSISDRINRHFLDSGATSQWGFAIGVIIHEFLHTTGKFKSDVKIGPDGKVDSDKSQKYQKEVLKKCKTEIAKVAQPGV